MDRESIAKRVNRLEALSRELALEITQWRAAQDPLLYLERRAVIVAMQDALGGIESARVLLVKASIRLAGQKQEETAGG